MFKFLVLIIRHAKFGTHQSEAKFETSSNLFNEHAQMDGITGSGRDCKKTKIVKHYR